jgi:hypothetical protein
MRRFVPVLIVLAGLLASVSTAYATFLVAGSGPGASRAQTVGLPTNTQATATSSSSIHITWSAPAAPSAAPSQYVVRRTTPTTATVCTVTIPATLACDDTGLTASTTYSFTVEARVGSNWSSGQTATFSATTPGPPNFLVQLLAPGSKNAGTAFQVQLTATTNGVTTDTNYSGSHAITFSGPHNSPGGNAPTYPATVTFVNGVSQPNPSVTLFDAETVALNATDGTRSGSLTVTVVPVAASQLRYTTSNPSCASGTVIVGNGGTLTSYVSLLDKYSNTTTAASSTTITLTPSPTGTGTLSPTSLTVASGASQTSGSLTFTGPTGGGKWSVTITASSPPLTTTGCTVSKT